MNLKEKVYLESFDDLCEFEGHNLYKEEDVSKAILKYARYIELWELYSIGSYCPDKFEKEFGDWCDNPKYMIKEIFGDYN